MFVHLIVGDIHGFQVITFYINNVHKIPKKAARNSFSKEVYNKLCEAFAAVYPSIYQRLLETLIDPVLVLEAQTALRKKGFEEIRKPSSKSHNHVFKMERVDSN